jgi:hypothetical protein
MRTFVYTVTVHVRDDVVSRRVGNTTAHEHLASDLDMAFQAGIGQIGWLSGRTLIDDDSCVDEVLPEITEVHGQRLRYDAPAEAVIADQREVIALAEALAPVGWSSTGWPEDDDTVEVSDDERQEAVRLFFG